MTRQEKSKENVQDNRYQKDFDNLYELYENQKYLDVISNFEKLVNQIDSVEFLVHIDLAISVYKAVFSSCIFLVMYESALNYILQAENLYKKYKSIYKQVLKNRKDLLQKNPNNKRKLRAIISEMAQFLETFNEKGKFELYINIAFAYYKNKKYSEACKYYEKINIEKIRKYLNYQDYMQYCVGRIQAIYYCYHHKKFPDTFYKKVENYINELKKMPSDVEVLLSLGKLYYFIGNEKKALNFIESALMLNNDKNKIYAYDWLSRITYHQKKYRLAQNFYKKIISILVESKDVQINNFSSIHPRPILFDMLKYLNETEELLAKQETIGLNKSIWAGIFITSIFGLIDLYSKHWSIQKLGVLFLIIVLLALMIMYFKIDFWGWCQKHLPVYSKLVNRILKKLL